MPNKKVECSRCKASKWTTEFDEGSFEEVSEESVCIFCKLREETLKLAAETQRLALETQKLTLENQELKARQEADRAYAAGLEQEIKNLIARSNGSSSVKQFSATSAMVRDTTADGEIQKEEAYLEKERTRKERRKMKKAEKKQRQKEEKKRKDEIKRKEKEEKRKKEETKMKNEEENRKKVEKKDQKRKEGNSGRKVLEHKPPARSSKGASVSIVGDSQARGLQPLMAARLRTSVKVGCLPGRGNTAIRAEAERSPLSDSSVAVLMVSGNDLYLRGGRIGCSDGILDTVMGAVEDCGLKTRRRVVVGMLPRRGPSRIAHLWNQDLNRRLADLCTAEGVFFVDPFNTFIGRNDLLHKDGVHLSFKGKAVLCNMVQDVVQRTLRCVSPGAKVDLRQYAHVTPEKNFSKVVREGANPSPPGTKNSARTENKNKGGSGNGRG